MVGNSSDRVDGKVPSSTEVPDYCYRHVLIFASYKVSTFLHVKAREDCCTQLLTSIWVSRCGRKMYGVSGFFPGPQIHFEQEVCVCVGGE